MIALNHNLLAANTANNLSSHYGRLQTSTERLSSGLRINSAADDAAGLAIRELMRADIAAYRQGMRNVNDAISMIQTFDGALGIIDEKLIRMKELAEQAATGTYNSTQRLMIDSEFQAMGAEINRIARATDFNGIKLLDGSGLYGQVDDDPAAGQIDGKIATRAITNTVQVGDKTYEINFDPLLVTAQLNATATEVPRDHDGDPATPDITGWDLSGIANPAALEGLTHLEVVNDGAVKLGDQYLLVRPDGFPSIPAGTQMTIEYDPTNPPGFSHGWSITADGQPATINRGDAGYCMFSVTTNGVTQAYIIDVYNPGDPTDNELPGATGLTNWTAPADDNHFTAGATTINNGTPAPVSATVTATVAGNRLDMAIDLGNGNTISNAWTIQNGDALAITDISIDIEIKDVTPPPTPPTPPNPPVPPGPDNPDGPGNPAYPANSDDPSAPGYQIPTDVVRIHFGPGADKKEDFYDIKKYDATLKGLGLEGVDIQTQEKAQQALVQVNDAIVATDKIRADYGAMQNRLENTLANITIQGENLQAAESRISDTDVATEMMNFVRYQILTQSAVAMLSQANSLPQMVMNLVK